MSSISPKKPNNNSSQKTVKPFGIQDKFGYMLGDFGNSLLFNFIGSYLLVFYTDAFGISAAAVGTLMAVSRIWDAINDPMMGVLVDKRKAGKDGKFRPYLKYMGIPLAIFTILTFLVIPNMPQHMKLRQNQRHCRVRARRSPSHRRRTCSAPAR